MSGSRKLCAASPHPHPQSSQGFLILSPHPEQFWQAQGPVVPHSALPAFRPPPQASCLGDLLPAPLLPDLGRVTITGPALHSYGPQLWAPNFMPPSALPPQRHRPTSIGRDLSEHLILAVPDLPPYICPAQRGRGW